MKSYRRLGWANARVIACLVTLGGAIFSGATAQAAPQYDLDCAACHQMPPRDSASGLRVPDSGSVKGNHETHAGSGANACIKCHGTQVTLTGHRDGIIQVQDNINGSNGASYSRGFFNQTSVPPATLGSCSSVNCHFESVTPEWGSQPLDQPGVISCGICHEALPSSKAHSKHIAQYGGDLSVCARCHIDHTLEAKPFQHATSAGHTVKSINVSVGSYSGSNFAYLPSEVGSRTLGSCSNLYCHSPGQSVTGGPLGAGDYANPNWGNPGSGACGSCHATAGALSGSHGRHLASDGRCQNCHVNATVTAYSDQGHADGRIDVALGGYDKGGAPGNGYGTCSSASCHANPYSSASTTTPQWGQAAGCGACHNGIGAFAGDGAPATGSHAAHLAIPGATCGQCHQDAVKDDRGGASHANASVEVTNDYSGAPVAKHAPGSYTGTCSSASCHADPYGPATTISPVWGESAGCASCHNGPGALTANGAPATGSHLKHMAIVGSDCNQCHQDALKNDSGGASHANSLVEVTNGYTASPVTKHPIGTYAGSCSSASCHSDGNGAITQTPKWGVAMPANCSGCHGGSATVTPVSARLATGKHRPHMNNYSTLGRGNNFMCAECHAKTVAMDSNTLVTGAGHLNSFKDYSGAMAGGSSSYASASGVCSNVYCHSSGQATPVFRNMTGSKSWRNSAKLDCNGCHGGVTGLGAPEYANRYDGTIATANSHEKHTAGMTDSRGCAKCHSSSVDRGVAAKMRDYSSQHLNRSRDVSFQLSGSYDGQNKTCSTYCHSNIQAPGGSGSATVYGTPAWGANGSTGCSSCHADMATLPESAASLALGSHKRHTVDTAYDCSVCHGAGNSAGAAGPAHADGSIDLAFTGAAAGITYSQPLKNVPGGGYGTCSTGACHGRATRNWGVSTTLPTCEKCHGSANSAQVSGVFKDTAGSPASPYSGTHVSHLAGLHNYSDPVTCDQCHVVPAGVNSPGHMDSLPATVVWGSLATHPTITGGVEGAVMVPSYQAGRVCANTYCHSGLRKADGTPQGTGANPAWNDSGYLGGTGCAKCHMNPPAYPHSSSINCSACHNHVAQSNIAFTDKSKHLNGNIEVTVDDCLGCHSSVNVCSDTDPNCINKELIGAHTSHTDAEIFLTGKNLSNGDYIDPSWIYGIVYKDGFPKYGCGFCHPMDSGFHKNNEVELDLDPSHSLAGTVKTRNKAGGPWVVSYTLGTSVVCNNVYCHSNGYVSETTSQYQFQQTPDWYATNPWGAVDKCAQCHGNSPDSGVIEGSAAHGRHVVGNHYQDIFDGYSSHIAHAGGPGSGAAHGDPATSTTFNCNLCHYSTVRVAYNDRGSVCIDCHTSSGSAPLKGTMDVFATNLTHVNGEVDVEFTPFKVKSKAQLREGISAVQSVYTSWTRVNGYKNANSYDLARTTPSYVGGSCSTVACHNGTPMEWRTKGPLACAACHTGLPQ